MLTTTATERMFLAVWSKKWDEVEQALVEGGNTRARDINGNTIAMILANSCKLTPDLAERLYLEWGADPCARDTYGRPVDSLCARNGSFSVRLAHVLYSRCGLNPCAMDSYRESAGSALIMQDGGGYGAWSGYATDEAILSSLSVITSRLESPERYAVSGACSIGAKVAIAVHKRYLPAYVENYLLSLSVIERSIVLPELLISIISIVSRWRDPDADRLLVMMFSDTLQGYSMLPEVAEFLYLTLNDSPKMEYKIL